MNCKVFPFMTSSSCTEPPNEKRFETYRRKDKILNWTLLYLRSTWNFPFKDECANLMSSSTLGIHGFVDLIFSIKITRIILSGNKKGLFVFTFSVIPVGAILPIKKNVTVLFSLMCSLLWEVFSAIAPLSADQVPKKSGCRWRHGCTHCWVWLLLGAATLAGDSQGSDVSSRDGDGMLVSLVFRLNPCTCAWCACTHRSVHTTVSVSTALEQNECFWLLY